MAQTFRETRNDISLFLSSLRRSVDRPIRSTGPELEADRERFTRTMMTIEEARIRLNLSTRFQDDPTPEEWLALRSGLLDFVNAFINSKDVDPTVYDRRFILSPVLGRDRENRTPFMDFLFSTRDKAVLVADALIRFRAYLEEEAEFKIEAVQGALSLSDLDRIVPRQQVAPIQFDVVNGQIVVAKKSPKVFDQDKDNINSALDYIKNSGNQLIRTLENSNCDRRLLDSVKELQSQLVCDSNVVKIGLTNMACGVMSAQFQSELPDAVNAMCASYNASISMYVSQFPEWNQFIQKAAVIDLEKEDIDEVANAASSLIDLLNRNPSLADPEVPRTIAFVKQFLYFPGASSKSLTRIAFAIPAA